MERCIRMKKWIRALASLMAVLMLASAFTFESGDFFKASALRTEVVRDYTVGKTIDYDSAFASAYIIVPDLNTSTAVSFTYRGRAVSETYSAKRHFATVAEAVAYHQTTGSADPVFYLCAGTYNSSRLYFPENAIILGANAGVTPNGALDFDLPDVTQGWAAADRYAETVITLGINAKGNTVIDGITYSGTATFYVAADNNSKANENITVTLQNSVLSGFAASSRFFDASSAAKDSFGYDIKECRFSDSAATAPFYSNIRFIHTDGVYFTNITGSVFNTSAGISSYEFSLDFYRTYVYKCPTSTYGLYTKYTDGKHKTSLVFDKFLWYEGNNGAFGFITFYTTPDGPGTSHNVDIINSTFLADRSVIDIERKTLINGNQSSYQLGTYTINFNNNRVIGFGSMFPNVGGQAGTQRIHADFNNNYFASSFTSVSDTSSLRSEYNFWSQAHGTNDFNNIDYARIDNLNYYTDYALTTSTRDFYLTGVSFFDNVDYVSIDNTNLDIYVGMREGTVTNPQIFFEEPDVTATLYKTHTTILGYQSFSTKLTSFSAPAKGKSVTYHFKAVKGSVTKCIELHVYGEDAVPYFKTDYTDPTGSLSSSAYLLYSGTATSGDVQVEVDGKPYLFTLGTNAFKTVDEIFTKAGSNVPEIFVPYGSYGALNLTKPCKIVGQNRRGSVYTSLDGACMRGSAWLNGKSAKFSSVTVGCDGVSLKGITFGGKLAYTQAVPVSIENCEFTDASYIELASGTASVNLSGLGITSTAANFITGALPSTVNVQNCYFKNGTALTNLTWGVDQSSTACTLNVEFCRFDNIASPVISDVRRGLATDTSNIVMNVTNNVFGVKDSSKYAVSIKPAYYNSLVFTENTFVGTSDSGSPLYIDTADSITALDFERNRFIGFAGITISDESVGFDGSYNYFAPYTSDYESAENGIAIPGEIMCSYYYSDYTLTTLKPSVTGFEFSDNVTVSGDVITLVTDSDVTDITKEITAECAYALWDERAESVDPDAVPTAYDTNVFTLRFYNEHAPCNRIDYTLRVVREGAEELSFITDSGVQSRDENGRYVLTLPEYVTGTSFAVAGHDGAKLILGNTEVDGITDIREGESADYIVLVNGIKYRLHVVIPLSSGVYIDYDGVVDTAYIIGADKSGNSVSFYYRGNTVTQTYDSARHFDSFEEAYAAYVASGVDIVRATPVFIFAPGNYSAISLKYRTVILGANAGISPVASVTSESAPYTVPVLSDKRSDTNATVFYGSISRAADDGSIVTAENASDNRLVYYTVIDGIDVKSGINPFFNENNYRTHYLSLQNITSQSPLTSGGGVGEVTVKNAYVHGVRAVTEMSTDKLTVDGSYVTEAISLFSGSNNVTVKKNFIQECPTSLTLEGTVLLDKNIISGIYGVTVSGNADSAVKDNIISGKMPVNVSESTFVDGNRFIGCESVNAVNLGKNYLALNFKNEDDISGLAIGEDYYYDYNKQLARSDFDLAGVSFDEGIHSSEIDNDGAVVKLTLTDKNSHNITFIPATNGVVASVEGAGISSGNKYLLTLSKGGYSRQFTVIAVFDDAKFFTDSRGYGDIKNTAVMIDPDSVLFNGEGGLIEWKDKTYKYVYGVNLFRTVLEAREALTGHLQIMLPAVSFTDDFEIPADSSIYGVNFDINPNIQSEVLGEDWVKNDKWGVYGETEIRNIQVPKNATGTLVEIHGITVRGRINDNVRASSSLCTEFNMINTVIEHQDWVAGSTNYTITLTNSNSTSGKTNVDRGMIKNMRVEQIMVNQDVAGNKNRFLNERLPQTFVIDGLYMDMTASNCSLFGWMKMSDKQQNGSFTMKNSNLRNAMNISTTANLSIEGRDHNVVRADESVTATIENCTFYNFQPGKRYALGIATQAYSEINIKNNLFISTSTPSVQAFSFTAASTLTNTALNIKNNRFVGTKNVINFSGEGTVDLSDNYYNTYSSNYQNVTTSSQLSGTNAVCNSYFVDYDLHFRATDIAPYKFGNGIEADYENKTLSLELDSMHGTAFDIANYVVSDGGHTIACDLTTLSAGENTGTVTVAGSISYTLTVYLRSVREELSEICEEAQALMQSADYPLYTEASRRTLEREYNRSLNAVGNTAVTEVKLAEYKTALINAMGGLTVDKSELTALIASVPDNADGRYSEKSYQHLTDVVSACKALGSNVSASVVENYVFDLKTAIADLVDVREYNKVIANARAVADNGIYSGSAVAQFKARVEEIVANAVIDTDIDVQRTISLINNAYAYLTKDCVALNSAISRAEALKETDCTVISYNNVKTALEKAYAINEDSYQAEVDSAAAELKLALDKVVYAKDFNRALARALALTNDGQYSDESFATYTVNLDNIRARSLSFASSNDVLKGISDIAVASAGLITNPTAYDTALNRYRGLTGSTYTAASYSVATKCYNDALAINPAVASEQDVAYAVDALNRAIDYLVLKVDAVSKITALKGATFDDSYCANTVEAYFTYVNALVADDATSYQKLLDWELAAKEIVKQHAYNYVNDNNATCTAPATETGTCQCGKTVTRVIEGSELGHSFGEYVYNYDATFAHDGTKTAKCALCGIEDTVLAEGTMLTLEPQDTSKTFTDVKADKWYKQAIDYTYSYGLIAGMSKTEFGISKTVTRGMFVTILARIAGVDTSGTANKNANQVFEDVKVGKYYSAAVEWAYNNKVVAGVDEKNFAPDAPIERQQLCVMIVNFAKFAKLNIIPAEDAIVFGDAFGFAKYSREAIGICQRADIINGYKTDGGFEFRAKDFATRAEAAQILYKFHSVFVTK